MTIKEVEKALEIPRATVRYYEKEKLIKPQREDNGYRNYSEEDVERLKKIIVLRKAGLSVEDIEDLFDGAKTVAEVIDENLINLQKHIKELQGAVNLCNKMKEDKAELISFNTNAYWNFVNAEEKQGNRFMDIAKDIVNEEKKVLTGYLGWTDFEGNFYNKSGFVGALVKEIILMLAVGLVFCMIKKDFSIHNITIVFRGMLTLVIFECVFAVPLYFLGKRFPWIAKHRVASVYIAAFAIIFIVLIILNL